MVEWRIREREMRSDAGIHHEILELQRIACAGQLTIPNMAGTSPDAAGNITDMRSSR
jgi:hypothetical protein